jgi:sRNA-binding carbon storage regulator CsrA
MLKLTRRVDESIILKSKKTDGELSEIVVTEIKSSQAKIEVTAAPSVLIDQYETQQAHLQWINPLKVIVISDKATGDLIARIHYQSSKGNQVTLGIEAPLSVIADRYEIHQRKLKEGNHRECLLSA